MRIEMNLMIGSHMLVMGLSRVNSEGSLFLDIELQSVGEE